MIYLDNAATSFPKPPGVTEAMVRFMTDVGANPGRAAHRLSLEAGRILYDTREAVAELFGVADPVRVIFTANATEGINLVLNGYLQPGDHVITSGMEHNSVMRPLRELERGGVLLSVVDCAPRGLLDPDRVAEAIRAETRLIVLNHASNVTGGILPVREVGTLARQRGIMLAVDAAQTAGAVPIDLSDAGIDFLIFSGHKSLFGPQGTGGVVLGERVEPEALRPLRLGGTGSRSAQQEQPLFLPDRFESGTPNTVGLAGLGAGVRFLLSEGIEKIRDCETRLMETLLDGLSEIGGVTVCGPARAARMTPTVSFVIDGVPLSQAAMRLDEEHQVLCRVGLHCAPAAHRTIGTFPEGTIRFSPGYFTTEGDVEAALRGVRDLAG